MNRLNTAFEEENAFLFAMLGAVSLGNGLADQVPAVAPAAPAAPAEDPVLLALLGLLGLRSQLAAALPAPASLPAPLPAPPTPSAPADLLR